MNESGIDITPIINAMITFVLATVSAFLVPWIKKKMNEEDTNTLLQWVEIAVYAAQQLYHNLSGEERKKYVLDFLAQKGYTVNEKEVDAAIEAAVLKLHQELEKNEKIAK